MWKENELLEMMKANYEIFGKEILNIKKAKQEWLINYFEDKLYAMLDMWVAVNSYYAREELDCHLTAHKRKDFNRFNLTPKQCIEIFSFIYPRYFRKGRAVRLNEWDSRIVLNYIESGYDMYKYKLFYYGGNN